MHTSFLLVLGLMRLCNQLEILDTKNATFYYAERFYLEVWYIFKRYSYLIFWQGWDEGAAPPCDILHKSSWAPHPVSATWLFRTWQMKL